MLRIRIVAAVAVVVSVLAAAGAIAQTADQAGEPIKLLAGLRPPHQTKAREGRASVHAKTAHKFHNNVAKLAARTKPSGKKHKTVAAARSEPAQTTPVAPPADSAVAPPQAVPADNAPQPSAITVGGQTVQVYSPNQVNALDLAAGDNSAAASPAAPSDPTDAAPAAPTVLAAPMHADTSQNADSVGSASWIAQVLAAFGGAVAAGAVAWFLIGSGPVRIYG